MEGRIKGAVRKSKELGLEIQAAFPEVADEYRAGLTLDEIVTKHSIDEFFDVKRRTAVTAVYNAIAGHPGGLRVQKYEGMIKDREELETICYLHKSNGGKYTYENSIGLFRMSKQENADAGRKGGKISGDNNKKNKTRICGMTRQELKEAGQSSAISKGFVPWVEDAHLASEISYAYSLSRDEQYRDSRNRIRHSLIAKELNAAYHNGQLIRTGQTVKAALQRYIASRSY